MAVTRLLLPWLLHGCCYRGCYTAAVSVDGRTQTNHAALGILGKNSIFTSYLAATHAAGAVTAVTMAVTTAVSESITAAGHPVSGQSSMENC